MSHLVEEYAKNLGCKIGKPYLSSHFYPVIPDKYITFHTNEKKVQSKHYDYWRIVFKLIAPFLQKEGIKIVQIGGPEDPSFKECDQNTCGCSFKQMAYVIEGSLMHFGIDSLPMHIASMHDKKMVCLFSNLYPENANPIWNKKNKYILHSPDFSETKPSFSFNESPKRINEILPEKVASDILDCLDLNHDIREYETLNIGKHYNNNITEVIPDFIPSADLTFNNLINLRCDYELLMESLPHWLSRRVNLMIDSPIDIKILSRYKSNIAGMTVFVGKDNFDEEYFRLLSRLKISYTLITKDLNNIGEIRLKFFDYTVEEYKPAKKKDLDFISDVCDNTYYHSNKVLMSKNQEYYSKAAWKKGIAKDDSHQSVIDSPDFWEEIQHFNIYNHGKSKI